MSQRLWMKWMEIGAASGCHQRPDRSFFIGKYQMPVCARCLGVGLGQVAACAAAFFHRPTYWYGLLLIPLGIDALSQHSGWRQSNNRLRLLTGLLAGFGNLSVLLAFILPKRRP